MIPLRDVNPSQRRPVITWFLIAANAGLFLYELALGARLDAFLAQAAFVPARVAAEGGLAGGAYAVQSALLSMFLHAGWLHFLGNMLFLWIFGDNVEDRLGHGRYLLFYLLCGYAATAAHGLANASSAVPAIGASGAIAGVLGAYLLLFPKARIVTLLFLGLFSRLIEIPAIVYLLLWFGLQFFAGLASLGEQSDGGGVAWFAHIGGFVAGPLLALLLGARKERTSPLARVEW